MIPRHLRQAVVQVNEPDRLEEMNRNLTADRAKEVQEERAKWFKSWNVDMEQVVLGAADNMYFSQDDSDGNSKSETEGEAPSQYVEDGSNQDSNDTEDVCSKGEEGIQETTGSTP